MTDAAKPRRWLGLFDLALAGLHAYLGLVLAPSRRPFFVAAVVALVVIEGLAGLALFFGVRGATKLGRVAGAATISVGAIIIIGLIASAGFLRGAYGALGQGLALGVVIAIVVVSHLFVLPGIWQLRCLPATSGPAKPS